MSAQQRLFAKRQIEGALDGFLLSLDPERTARLVDLCLVQLEVLVPDRHVRTILCEHEARNAPRARTYRFRRPAQTLLIQGASAVSRAFGRPSRGLE
jgi:hypothetical protein